MTSIAYYRQLAVAAVAAILNDLSDRRGLRQAWDGIDVDIANEIRDEWERIVENTITPEPMPATDPKDIIAFLAGEWKPGD